MEKIIYPVWKLSHQSMNDFNTALLGSMSEALLASGLKKLRINVVDDDVAAASKLRHENMTPLMDAVISMWVDSYIYRDKQQAILSDYVDRYDGYLVTESEPLVNTIHPAQPGQRTLGMSQLAFLQKPERLSRHEWLDIWHNSHTQVAIDTQSTFGYRQNVVVMAVTEGAPNIDAIVEENFPVEAMTSPHAFYHAFDEQGNRDDAKLAEHGKLMAESCARFIDFTDINVLPTSEYNLKS